MPSSIESRRRRGQADIKVIGAGLPRTGTTSLKHALHLLLGGPCHHFDEVIADMSQSAFWLAAYETGHTPEEWDAFFSSHGYVATVDAPSCDFVKYLADLYPEAKVVITTRDADKWYRSMVSTIGTGRGPSRYMKMWYDYLLPQYETFEAFRAHTFFGAQAVCRGRPLTPQILPAYVADLQSFFAMRGESDRVLVYDLDSSQGWDDLCPFLGVPEPNVPMPHANWSVQPAATPADRGSEGSSKATHPALTRAQENDFKEREVYARLRHDFRRARKIARSVTVLTSLTTVLGIGAILYSRSHKK